MKFAWLIFTFLFAFISTQQVGKFKVLDDEPGIELEKNEKSSHKNGEGFDNIPFLFLTIPSLFHFHGPKFFSSTFLNVAPLVLKYDVRFVHTDCSPPSVG